MGDEGGGAASSPDSAGEESISCDAATVLLLDAKAPNSWLIDDDGAAKASWEVSTGEDFVSVDSVTVLLLDAKAPNS